jgi:crossover junction endonuclease MUS81
MSPERVSALLDCWETPRALYDAMVARHAQGEILVGRKTRKPETFFADNVAGEGRRKIGEALSRDVS